MKKNSLLLILIISLLLQRSFAQDSSAHLRISLLTCGAGEDLYSTWGHTAIRIVDSARQTDIVYNYGNFDFQDPDFYSKFTRGKLDYYLAASGFAEFMYEYQVDKRDVTEQELRLTENTKLHIRRVLNETLNSPARMYKYDFAYNNCTSRVRDILINLAGLQLEKPLVPEGTTIRNMLHEFLDKGGQPWSKLGIDLLLGSPIDRKVNKMESMFLPDYLMKAADSSTNKLVARKTILNQGMPLTPARNWPLYIFSVVALLIIGTSLISTGVAIILIRILDTLLFLLTGLLGCFILFMWFGTDHKACAANYNLLWALPTHFIAAFFVWKKPNRFTKYFTACSILYILLLITWFWLPQQLNPAFIPVTFLLLFRSVQLRK